MNNDNLRGMLGRERMPLMPWVLLEEIIPVAAGGSSLPQPDPSPGPAGLLVVSPSSPALLRRRVKPLELERQADLILACPERRATERGSESNGPRSLRGG